MGSPEHTRNASPAALLVGLTLGACFIGLTHDFSYLNAVEELSVESGAHIEKQEKLEQDVSNAPWHRHMGFVGIALIGLGCWLTAPRKAQFVLTPVVLLFGCYLVLIFCSWYWSIERGETSRELVRVAVYLFVAAGLVKRFRPTDLCFAIMVMTLSSVVTASAAEVLAGNFRPWRSEFRMHGTIHSNVLASHAMVTLVAAFAFLRQAKAKLPWRAIVLAMLAVILLTKTRGALAASLVGMTAIYVVDKPLRANIVWVSMLMSMISFGGLIVVLAGPQLKQELQSTATLGRSEGVETLTGRIPLWQELWHQSSDHRWLGYGYGAFWTTEQVEELAEELEWYPGHAHSVYMHTILDLGVAGLFFMIVLVIFSLHRASWLIRTRGRNEYKFAFGLLAAGIVDGILEVSFVYPRGLGLIVAAALMSLSALHPEAAAITGKAASGARSSLAAVRKPSPWSGSPLGTH